MKEFITHRQLLNNLLNEFNSINSLNSQLEETGFQNACMWNLINEYKNGISELFKVIYDDWKRINFK